LAGSFIILTTTSYAIPFTANILSGRKYFPKGPFHLGKFGMPVNILAVLFITLFNVFYCFRKVFLSLSAPRLVLTDTNNFR
jgi:choline transport protein